MQFFETILPGYYSVDQRTLRKLDLQHSQPDIQAEGTPRNYQLNCQRSFQDQALVNAAGHENEKRMSGALTVYTPDELSRIYDAIDADLGSDVPSLCRDLMTTNKVGDDSNVITCTIDSPFMRARELRDYFDEQDLWEQVNGTVAFQCVDSINALVEDDALRETITQLYQAIHADKTEVMTAHAVTCLFGILEQTSRAVQEAALVKAAEADAGLAGLVNKALDWRTYLVANEAILPKSKPVSKLKPVV